MSTKKINQLEEAETLHEELRLLQTAINTLRTQPDQVFRTQTEYGITSTNTISASSEFPINWDMEWCKKISMALLEQYFTNKGFETQEDGNITYEVNT